MTLLGDFAIKKRLFPILVAILMMFAMMPMTAGTVHASTSESPIVGFTGVLGTGANTDNAQTVYYGVNGGTPIAWRVIKYKDTGNDYITYPEDQNNAMTLFAANNLTTGVKFATNGKNDYVDSNLKAVLDGKVLNRPVMATYSEKKYGHATEESVLCRRGIERRC